MKRLMLFCLVLSNALAEVHDFEFREMDFQEVLSSIARVQKKNVVFSPLLKEQKVTISLKQITAEQAFQTILKNLNFITVEESGILRVVPPVDRAPASQNMTIFPLTNVLAKEIENNVKTFLGSEGTVSLNEPMNALVVNCTPDTVPKVRALITELDQENNQIFIEAKIIETSTTFSRQLGIEWGSPLGSRPHVAGASLDAKVANNVLMGGLSVAIADRSQLEARITAGERNGDLKVVSSPKITTLNGMGATIESSTTFNVRTLAPVSGSAGSAALAGGLQPVKAGVRLKVTPSIVSQSQVRLDLTISKSEADFSHLIDGIPGISDNSAATALIVRNGETASIGGIIYQSRSENLSGVPFLTKLPILGILFGSSETEKKDRELLIFLTPTIFKRSQKF